MIVSSSFYLVAEVYRQWLDVSPAAVSLDPYNVQKAPLRINMYIGDGADKEAMSAYIRIVIESVAGSSVTTLATINCGNVSSYSYTLPSNNYATATRIKVSAYSNSGYTTLIDEKYVSIVVEDAVPYPRYEPWSASLEFKNGEFIQVGDMLYIWSSRVSGNTTVSPAQSTDSRWKAYSYHKLFASAIAILGTALIGQSVFKGNYTYSQKGVNANGGESDNYPAFTNENGTAFTPNVLINWLTGAGWFARKNIKFNADGSIEITGKIQTSVGGKRIVIDPEGKSLSMYTSSDKEALRMSFDDSGGYEFGDIGLNLYNSDGTIMRRTRLQPERVVVQEGTSGVSCEVTPVAITAYGIGNVSTGIIPSVSLGLRKTSSNAYVADVSSNCWPTSADGAAQNGVYVGAVKHTFDDVVYTLAANVLMVKK